MTNAKLDIPKSLVHLRGRFDSPERLGFHLNGVGAQVLYGGVGHWGTGETISREDVISSPDVSS